MVVKTRAFTAPFDGTVVPGLGHGLAIIDPSGIEVIDEVLPGFLGNPFGRGLINGCGVLLDDVQPFG